MKFLALVSSVLIIGSISSALTPPDNITASGAIYTAVTNSQVPIESQPAVKDSYNLVWGDLSKDPKGKLYLMTWYAHAENYCSGLSYLGHQGRTPKINEALRLLNDMSFQPYSGDPLADLNTFGIIKNVSYDSTKPALSNMRMINQSDLSVIVSLDIGLPFPSELAWNFWVSGENDTYYMLNPVSGEIISSDNTKALPYPFAFARCVFDLN